MTESKTKELNIANWEPGEIKEIGNNLYGICCNCHKLVKINKFIFGSLHECR